MLLYIWKKISVGVIKSMMIIAEHLSARQLIVQRTHIVSVYIYNIYIYTLYMYVCTYIRHTLIARGKGRLHRCGFCGPDSHVHVLRVRNAELRKKRSIPGKGSLPQKRVRQRRESLTD